MLCSNTYCTARDPLEKCLICDCAPLYPPLWRPPFVHSRIGAASSAEPAREPQPLPPHGSLTPTRGSFSTAHPDSDLGGSQPHYPQYLSVSLFTRWPPLFPVSYLSSIWGQKALPPLGGWPWPWGKQGERTSLGSVCSRLGERVKKWDWQGAERVTWSLSRVFGPPWPDRQGCWEQEKGEQDRSLKAKHV